MKLESHHQSWVSLNDIDDAKAWIAHRNLELVYYFDQEDVAVQPKGQGICFTLELGGEIYAHTTDEGMILLDVTSDAEWAAPAIASCTGVQPPLGQVWVLSQGSLVQFVLGINSLIASTTLVLQHHFVTRHYLPTNNSF